jgi:hypothetical protein
VPSSNLLVDLKTPVLTSAKLVYKVSAARKIEVFSNTASLPFLSHPVLLVQPGLLSLSFLQEEIVITPSRVSIANKLRFDINFSFYLFDGKYMIFRKVEARL